MSGAVRHDPPSAGETMSASAPSPTRSRIMSKVSKRIALLGVISPALFAVSAVAQPIQLHSTLAGNNPSIVIGGVESAGSPWTVKSGFASLDASGKLRVRVRDLVLPATGDAGPVTAVSASLVCGGSGGTVQSETAPVPLSMKGNANLHGHIAVPSLCFVLLVACGFMLAWELGTSGVTAP